MRYYKGLFTRKGIYYPTKYLLWLQDQALSLHFAIVERLRPSRTALTYSPTWISAMDAHELAECLEVPLVLCTISKLARKDPPAFESRSGGRNRLYVRLDSFVEYLWHKRRQPEPETEGATDEEAAQAIEDADQEKRGKRDLG
jgi:hypothetical protein